MIELLPTPLQEYRDLARAIGVSTLCIKREDLNPSGSHKDRGLWPYVEKLKAQGVLEFCLSSSGNLAISAAYYAKENPDVRFHLFLPDSLSIEKSKRLRSFVSHSGLDPESRQKKQTENRDDLFSFLDSRFHGNDIGAGNLMIHWSRTPKSDAIRFSREKGVKLLRGSTDDGMLEGYHQLAQELLDQVKRYKPEAIRSPIGSMFVAVSSGTMAVGLWEGFKNIVGAGLAPARTGRTQGPPLPQMHIIQTSRVHPIVSAFDHDFTATKTSIASAIVDRVAHRKAQVIQAVKESGGWGWVVNDEEIIEAQEILQQHINSAPVRDSGKRDVPRQSAISSENAMALAGYRKAIERRYKINEPIVLLFTGK